MAEEKIVFGEEFDTNGEFSLIDAGEYEFVIDKVEPKTSKNGKNYLNFTLKIRDDVKGQKFGRRKLFYSVFKLENDNVYNFPIINKIILTQKGFPTYKDHFLEFDEVLLYLNGLHLIATVETVFDDYKGEDVNKIKDWSFKPSEWDKVDHSKDVVETNTAKLDIPESDLPF